MTTPTDPDFARAAEDFKRGGWVVALLGGAGMLARMLLNDEESKAIFWVRRFIAGAIVGCITYFALHGVNMSDIYKSLIMSTAGAASPELMEQVRQRFSKGLKKNEKETKSNGKRKRK